MTTFNSNGGLHVEGLGTDSSVYHKGNPNSQVGAWGGWENLGGGCIYYPVAITLDQSTLEVFVIGKDSALWAKVHDVHGAASTSAGWFNLGGVCMSAPVVCSWGPKNVSVFVIGTDRQAWCCMWNGTKWDWTCVAGQKLTDNSLAVASWGTGRLDLVGIGTDASLRHICYSGGKWNTWENLGGAWCGRPKAVAPRSGRLDIFAKGSDSKLWHAGWEGNWFPLHMVIDRIIIFEPEAVVWCAHRIDLFAISTGSGLLHAVGELQSTGGQGTWSSSWEEIGGICTESPKAVAREGKYVDCFVRGLDMAFFHKQWDGTQWQTSGTGFENLNGIFMTQPT